MSELYRIIHNEQRPHIELRLSSTIQQAHASLERQKTKVRNKGGEPEVKENFKNNEKTRKLNRCISNLRTLYNSSKVFLVHEVIQREGQPVSPEGIIEGLESDDTRICFYLIQRKTWSGNEYKEKYWASQKEKKQFNSSVARELSNNLPAILLAKKMEESHAALVQDAANQ